MYMYDKGCLFIFLCFISLVSNFGELSYAMTHHVPRIKNKNLSFLV